MKTILLTISRGFLARNILQTGMVKDMLARGHRVVIASPGSADPDFVAMFQEDRVTFESFHIPTWTWIDRRLRGLHHNLLWNRSVRFRTKYGVYTTPRFQWLRYILQWILFRPLALFPILRTWTRQLDARVRPADAVVRDQLKRIRPDVVFSTNPIEDADDMYLQAAKELKIPTITLVKSWDNMSKSCFRVLSDYVLVWGPYMAEEAEKYQLYPKEAIRQIGVPQFDIYLQKDRLTPRETFLQSLGLDPARKTIIFGSEGKVTPHDDEIVAGMARMIERQTLVAPSQILVRPHFGYKNDADKFQSVAHLPHVAIDRQNTPRPVFYDGWDYSRGHYERLAETLFAGDILVTTASTLAIDAVVAGIPAVTIVFDGDHHYPHNRSIARWYETEYYAHVLQTNAVVRAHNYAELQAILNALLVAPDTRMPERQALIQRFAGVRDGKAAARAADYVCTLAEQGTLSSHL
ncbi:MAG: CDP-glycerol glycerophosphotransferase family protein [Patescibacteria group bacterium]